MVDHVRSNNIVLENADFDTTPKGERRDVLVAQARLQLSLDTKLKPKDGMYSLQKLEPFLEEALPQTYRGAMRRIEDSCLGDSIGFATLCKALAGRSGSGLTKVVAFCQNTDKKYKTREVPEDLLK